MYDRFVAAAERAIRATNRGDAPWIDRRRRGRALPQPDGRRDDPRRDPRSASQAMATRRKAPAAANRRRGVGAAGGRTPSERAPRRPSCRSLDMTQTLSPREGGRADSSAAGAAQPAAAQGARSGRLDDPGVRGLGRRRQGRRDPPGDGGARCARLPGHPDRRADRRGARAALPLAILAPPVARRAASRSSTAAGTGACWSSASRASPPSASGSRAYAEINQFEEQLVEHGIVLVKYWLHITAGRAAAPLQGARGDRHTSAGS